MHLFGRFANEQSSSVQLSSATITSDDDIIPPPIPSVGFPMAARLSGKFSLIFNDDTNCLNSSGDFSAADATVILSKDIPNILAFLQKVDFNRGPHLGFRKEMSFPRRFFSS